jgi:hypothetical protein
VDGGQQGRQRRAPPRNQPEGIFKNAVPKAGIAHKAAKAMTSSEWHPWVVHFELFPRRDECRQFDSGVELWRVREDIFVGISPFAQ